MKDSERERVLSLLCGYSRSPGINFSEDCLYHHSTTMALVTIVGFPCCGKSTRAKQIKEYLEKRIQEETTEGPKLSVVLVDDDNSHVPRSTYDSEYSL